MFQWLDDFALAISAVPAFFVFTDGALLQSGPLIPFTKCVCVCVYVCVCVCPILSDSMCRCVCPIVWCLLRKGNEGGDALAMLH